MYALFDIGGTNMRVAVTENGEKFGEPVILETPQTFDFGLSALKNAIEKLAGGVKLKGIVGGVAGPFDRERTMLVNALHLPHWVGKPLKAELEKLCNAPAHLENDAALVGLGEAHFGAGRGFETVAYLTVSTGVGGVRITKGKLDLQLGTNSPEPGHQIIDVDHSACPVCAFPTLEAYVSGTATQERYGKKPNEITDPAVWSELAEYLAAGIANTIMHWVPDVVVLGGSMVVRKPGISAQDVNEKVRQLLSIYPTVPPIKEAELEALGGLYGGLALVRNLESSSSVTTTGATPVV